MEEPAGSEGCPCLLVKRTEYVFNVATANGPALILRGIDAPYELKKDVWSMKRGQGIAGVEAAYNAAPSVASGLGGGGCECCQVFVALLSTINITSITPNSISIITLLPWLKHAITAWRAM